MPQPNNEEKVKHICGSCQADISFDGKYGHEWYCTYYGGTAGVLMAMGKKLDELFYHLGMK